MLQLVYTGPAFSLRLRKFEIKFVSNVIDCADRKHGSRCHLQSCTIKPRWVAKKYNNECIEQCYRRPLHNNDESDTAAKAISVNYWEMYRMVVSCPHAYIISSHGSRRIEPPQSLYVRLRWLIARRVSMAVVVRERMQPWQSLRMLRNQLMCRFESMCETDSIWFDSLDWNGTERRVVVVFRMRWMEWSWIDW